MLRLPLPFLALLFAVAVAAASHRPVGRCETDGVGALGIVEFVVDASLSFYVDERGTVDGNGVWVYQESNGIWTDQGVGVHTGETTEHNLQRGGGCAWLPRPFPLLVEPSQCYIPGESEICTDVGDWDPDMWLY